MKKIRLVEKGDARGFILDKGSRKFLSKGKTRMMQRKWPGEDLGEEPYAKATIAKARTRHQEECEEDQVLGV